MDEENKSRNTIKLASKTKKSRLNIGKLDLKFKHKGHIESKTPRILQKASQENSLDGSNYMAKTFDENDCSIFDIKFREKKFQGPKTTELRQMSSISHLTDQFALKEYTEKEFQVMCAIVDQTKDEMNKAVNEMKERMETLNPIFNLISSFEISREKSIIGFITTHIYDCFIKNLNEQMATVAEMDKRAYKTDLEKVAEESRINKVDLEILKDRISEYSSKITGLQHESSIIRSIMQEKIDNEIFYEYKREADDIFSTK